MDWINSNEQKNIKKITFKKTEIEIMDEKSLNNKANEIVDFLYSFENDNFYEIGFINSKGNIISPEKSMFNLLETWNNFESWNE